MSVFTELKEGVEYIDNHSYRVVVTGFCRHALTRENFVMFKPVSFVTSGPHHTIATAEWWVGKGFREAPRQSVAGTIEKKDE